MDCAREWLPLLRTRLAALLAAFTGFTSPIAVTGHSQSQTARVERFEGRLRRGLAFGFMGQKWSEV